MQEQAKLTRADFLAVFIPRTQNHSKPEYIVTGRKWTRSKICI